MFTLKVVIVILSIFLNFFLVESVPSNKPVFGKIDPTLNIQRKLAIRNLAREIFWKTASVDELEKLERLKQKLQLGKSRSQKHKVSPIPGTFYLHHPINLLNHVIRKQQKKNGKKMSI